MSFHELTTAAYLTAPMEETAPNELPGLATEQPAAFSLEKLSRWVSCAIVLVLFAVGGVCYYASLDTTRKAAQDLAHQRSWFENWVTSAISRNNDDIQKSFQVPPSQDLSKLQWYDMNAEMQRNQQQFKALEASVEQMQRHQFQPNQRQLGR
jgi:hypothetical protein